MECLQRLVRSIQQRVGELVGLLLEFQEFLEVVLTEVVRECLVPSVGKVECLLH